MKRVLLWVLGVGVLLGFSQAYAACDITAVTSPNGGEQWSGTQSITWTQTGCTTEFVTIDFSSDS